MVRSLAVVIAVLFVFGNGVVFAGPGKGHGYGRATTGWSGGTPPGFSSRGLKRGWVDGHPRGWTKGRKRGWHGGTTPPGWRNR